MPVGFVNGAMNSIFDGYNDCVGLAFAISSKNVLNKEIMEPVVVLKGYDKFEDGVMMAVKNMIESGGIGHTAGLFSNNDAHIRYADKKIKSL